MTAHMKILSKLSPELFNRVRESMTPSMVEIDKIPSIYVQFSNTFALEKDPLMKKLKFIAIILKLYSPASLIAEVRVKDGVCAKISSSLGYSDVSNVSHMISRARAYMNVASFRDDVNSVVNWVMEKEVA